ncbi:MAG: hypothetical protein AAGJ79_01250 [Verrucomicrobiota bacterium]
MTASNPFSDDTAPLTTGVEEWNQTLAAIDVESVHAAEGQILTNALNRTGAKREEDTPAPVSELFLLRSPRAGFGKTHLLSRVFSRAPRNTSVFPTSLNSTVVGWPTVLRGLVNHLTEVDDGRHGALVSRRLIGNLLGNLIDRGEIQAAHGKSAVPALREHAETVFSRENENNPVIRWFVSNFSALRPILVRELGRVCHLTEVRAEFWLDVLRGFDLPDSGSRTAARLRAMFLPENEATLVAARERVMELCEISRLLGPVAVVFDPMDGLYGEPEAARKVATIAEELRELSKGLLVVMSMNQDVWETAFDGRLSSANADRLTSSMIDLKPVSRESLEILLRRRSLAAGSNEEETKDLLDRAEATILISDSPRTALRHAKHWWDQPSSPTDDDDDGGAESFLVSPVNGNGNGRPHGGGFGAFLDAEVVKESAPGSDDPAVSPFQTLRDPDETENIAKETFSPFANKAVFNLETNPAEIPPALRRFREIQREVSLRNENIAVDGKSLRQIVWLTGQTSPLVEVSEMNLNGSTHPRTADAVTRWKFPDTEIVFSFRSLDEDPGENGTWSRLAQFVESRNGDAPSKVVVFEEDGGSRSVPDFPWLDVVNIDSASRATLVATATVLAESASSNEAMDESFRQIAPELDGFWRRLTRPLEEKAQGK